MFKKKFLLITQAAYINDMAWQLKKEGCEVKYYIGYEPYKDLAEGFVDKVEDWRLHVEWADVIIIDAGVENGSRVSEELRAKGKKVIGGTVYTDRLEDDRAFGQEELKKIGVNIIPYTSFDSFEEAIAYVKNNPGRYVFKPDGDAQDNKSLLYVGEDKDGKDVIDILEQNKHNLQIKKFILQKKIDGVEIAVSGFFNGNRFIYPLNINFEHKKLFPGNIGPSTIEMGTSMFWYGENKLFEYTLKKLEHKLAQHNYVGVIDVNCILNEKGIFPLEFTPRFGYPTIGIQQSSLDMSLSEFFFRLASKEDFEIRVKPGFHIGVRIVLPPYPYDCPNVFNMYAKGARIRFRGEIPEGVHIEDVKIENGEWVVSGDVGAALLVTGSGKTMKQAQESAYGKISKIILSNMMYRNDIGDRWHKDIEKLHEWGYFKDI